MHGIHKKGKKKKRKKEKKKVQPNATQHTDLTHSAPQSANATIPSQHHPHGQSIPQSSVQHQHQHQHQQNKARLQFVVGRWFPVRY